MKERAKYIDIVKGISIICIVLLHYEDGIIPTHICTFIGSFMVSMFYITSGWLNAQQKKQQSLKELVRKRWFQLGIPYFSWTVIILAFDFILWGLGYYDVYFIGREIYKSIVLRGIGTLWFLPALFGGEIIWYLIRRKKSIVILCLALVLTVAYQSFYHTIFDGLTSSLGRIIDAPFHTISNILFAWVGIFAGYGFYRFYLVCQVLFNRKIKLLVTGLLLCAITYYNVNYLSIPLCGQFITLLGPIGIMLVTMVIQQWKIMEYFDYWGRYSLALMVTHYSLIQVLCEITNHALFSQPKLNGVPALGFFLLTMIIEYFIAEFLYRKAPALLGKWKQ